VFVGLDAGKASLNTDQVLPKRSSSTMQQAGQVKVATSTTATPLMMSSAATKRNFIELNI